MLATLHIVGALLGLLLGALVFGTTKGTRRHKMLGYSYVGTLLCVNISALLVYEQSLNGGPFHILAVISLLTLAAAMKPVLTKKPRARWLGSHAYFMAWSYLGLVGAGVGQLGAATVNGPPLMVVGIPITVVLIIGGAIIHTQTPRTLTTIRDQFA